MGKISGFPKKSKALPSLPSCLSTAPKEADPFDSVLAFVGEARNHEAECKLTMPQLSERKCAYDDDNAGLHGL